MPDLHALASDVLAEWDRVMDKMVVQARPAARPSDLAALADSLLPLRRAIEAGDGRTLHASHVFPPCTACGASARYPEAAEPCAHRRPLTVGGTSGTNPPPPPPIDTSAGRRQSKLLLVEALGKSGVAFYDKIFGAPVSTTDMATLLDRLGVVAVSESRRG